MLVTTPEILQLRVQTVHIPLLQEIDALIVKMENSVQVSSSSVAIHAQVVSTQLPIKSLALLVLQVTTAQQVQLLQLLAMSAYIVWGPQTLVNNALPAITVLIRQKNL